MTCVYTVGYSSYEESEYAYLTHERKFSEQEFKEIIFKTAIEAVHEMKKDKYSYLHSYQDIHDKVVKLLCEREGFKPIEITTAWSCFGWPSMFSKDDWAGQRSEAIDELTDKMIEAGFSVKDDDYLSREEREKETEARNHDDR